MPTNKETERVPPGSRWWKCDFHVHTPQSGADYQDANASPASIIDAAVSAGLEVVAITDHNTFGLTAELQACAANRGLVVFPGFEINAGSGIHLLAIFDVDTPANNVAATLGRCIDPRSVGDPGACSSTSAIEIASAIAQAGGLCLGAHVDGPSGCLSVLLKKRPDGTLGGSETLQALVTCRELHGVEMVGSETAMLGYLDNSKDGYKRLDGAIAIVEGSDAHRPEEVGRRFTMVKMSKPNLEGLRLALLDGEMSVRRGSVDAGSVNTHATSYLERIVVENARYVGRSVPFSVPLNPWLNAVIGSHGTGKSTLVEFVRAGLGRTGDVPKALEHELGKYQRPYKTRRDDGLLTNDTTIEITYRREQDRSRLRWKAGTTAPLVEQEQPDGSWRQVTADVSSRFPVRLFSQKQIYGLADDPNAILRIIDDVPEVGAAALRSEMAQFESQYFSLRSQARGEEAKIRDEVRLRGELDDVRKQLERHESSANRELLAAFEKLEQQDAALDAWSKAGAAAVAVLRRVAGDLLLPALDATLFPPQPGAPYSCLLDAQDGALRELTSAREAVSKLADPAEEAVRKLDAARAQPPWSEHARTIRDKLAALGQAGVATGAAAKADHAALIAKRKSLLDQLKTIDSAKLKLADLEKAAESIRDKMVTIRQTLTTRRRGFLAGVQTATPRLRVEITPFGNGFDAEAKIREAIQKTDQTFQDQLWAEDTKSGLVYQLYRSGQGAKDEAGFPTRLRDLGKQLRAVAAGADDAGLHGKFAAYLRKVPPESLDRLDILLPEDAVELAYLEPAGGGYRPISQGSPGQKSAAILAFVLSYGGDPLILDQPEDDLDGQLISDLIVEQLRQNKVRRQILVVTHNPNIVVNGDAEFVLPFETANGETHLVGGGGGLQELAVREHICRVMEGGRDALERRYRRIHGRATQ
ncbi:MAG: PHP domain-containing protein [Deltaproteobacteria bacterium]|nr:PHP domain-containing protein [Deltaproteobacteria bacterium]